jgi:Zn-dependent metalloprotease
MGASVNDTWKVGEDIYTPNTANDALRYMADPKLGGDYDWYPTRYMGTADYGGVHWNSGIANLAFKLMVSGKSPRL